MKLGKFIQCMFVVTVVALIYLHMQLKIFSLAYEGKEREQQLSRLKEDQTMVSYNILELKSASHLGSKIFTEDGVLRFCDRKSIVQVAAADSGSTGAAYGQKRKPGLIARFLSLQKQAEAEATEHKSGKPWQSAFRR
ncbi:MAG: hypothetical protein ACLFPX_02895 [Candidatus Omnitrophota bacterium]